MRVFATRHQNANANNKNDQKNHKTIQEHKIRMKPIVTPNEN